ncbi:hypothetical protein GEV33_001242 [Tenebrio molitor]|uniref:Gustatory receptor n=1 Tax=Tenebrio molitor TaxID=7067 RepID=A0A8J6HVE0_TENMO|nr:hypothetical protein GEV33_001242 [Tenebrio molitor]
MVARNTLFVFYFGFFIIVDLQYRDFNSYLMECSALFMLVMNSALCFLAIELIHILRARFKVLNQHINTLAQQGTKKTRKQGILPLNKICTLHHHLSKLIKSFNEIFGVILLLMFTLSFLVIVLSLFYTTAELQSSVIVWMDAFYAFMTSVTFIIDTIYVCDACYSTIQEANLSGELIHKIDAQDRHTIDEIEMFSLQIANEQVEFNAAGFFPINYTLVFSVSESPLLDLTKRHVETRNRCILCNLAAPIDAKMPFGFPNAPATLSPGVLVPRQLRRPANYTLVPEDDL